MRDKGNPPGKILLRNRGAGGVTEADLERRAGELAEIEGRPEPTPDDWALAREELGGEVLPEEVPEESGSLSHDPSDPPPNRGEQAVNHAEPDDDEEEAAERLAKEGVDEAEHDQMLAARRRRHE